jgi:hypothetical protein
MVAGDDIAEEAGRFVVPLLQVSNRDSVGVTVALSGELVEKFVGALSRFHPGLPTALSTGWRPRQLPPFAAAVQQPRSMRLTGGLQRRRSDAGFPGAHTGGMIEVRGPEQLDLSPEEFGVPLLLGRKQGPAEPPFDQPRKLATHLGQLAGPPRLTVDALAPLIHLSTVGRAAPRP